MRECEMFMSQEYTTAEMPTDLVLTDKKNSRSEMLLNQFD